MEPRFIYEASSPIALRDHTGQWWKMSECTRCGQCCLDMAPNWRFAKDTSGGCIYLEQEEGGLYRCSLGKAERPHRCSGNSPFAQPNYCGVEFAKITETEAAVILLSV